MYNKIAHVFFKHIRKILKNPMRIEKNRKIEKYSSQKKATK